MPPAPWLIVLTQLAVLLPIVAIGIVIVFAMLAWSRAGGPRAARSGRSPAAWPDF